MKTQKNFLRYFVEFIVILSGVSASFWVEEYRESLQNDEEMYKVLNNLKMELDEIDTYCKEREIVFNKDSEIINLLTNNQSNSLDSIILLVDSTFEIEVAIIDYRGFRPPMDRYNSIINEGTLKFVKSDKIKELLSQLNNTFYYYVRANVDDEKTIQQKISTYLIENYPEIILAENNIPLNNYLKNLKKKIDNDLTLKAYLKTKSRTMYVKTFFLKEYNKTLLILRDEIEEYLSI
ncbi:MAG: hypothetical protein ACJZZ9_01320 [Cytophagales bacterium]|tara:strand:+ start:4174 stop:4878 length:705 start_codon:yes stop_codon:yes gene_type:complete